MMNLFEIMQAAQGGNAYDNLARQFGIAPEQARSAVEAVLPAISMGLETQAKSVEGWQNILGAIGGAQSNATAFFDSDGDGIPDFLEKAGGVNPLQALFGGDNRSESVANHAAQFAGLPANLVQQMLPVIAAMVLGGLFKGASNAGLGGILGQMMQGGAGGAGGFGSILGSVLGQGMAPQAQGGAGGAFGDIIGSMLGGGARPRQPEPDPVAAGLDMLKGMFQTGRDVQNTQMDALQQIFGQLSGRK